MGCLWHGLLYKEVRGCLDKDRQWCVSGVFWGYCRFLLDGWIWCLTGVLVSHRRTFYLCKSDIFCKSLFMDSYSGFCCHVYTESHLDSATADKI